MPPKAAFFGVLEWLCPAPTRSADTSDALADAVADVHPRPRALWHKQASSLTHSVHAQIISDAAERVPPPCTAVQLPSRWAVFVSEIMRCSGAMHSLRGRACGRAERGC